MVSSGSSSSSDEEGVLSDATLEAAIKTRRGALRQRMQYLQQGPGGSAADAASKKAEDLGSTGHAEPNNTPRNKESRVALYQREIASAKAEALAEVPEHASSTGKLVLVGREIAGCKYGVVVPPPVVVENVGGEKHGGVAAPPVVVDDASCLSSPSKKRAPEEDASSDSRLPSHLSKKSARGEGVHASACWGDEDMWSGSSSSEDSSSD